MTRDEALNLRRFKNLCTCGGYAHSMNGRPESQPHMEWCPQFAEYAEWWEAKNSAPTRQQEKQP